MSTFQLTLNNGDTHGRFPDPNDVNYEYQVVRIRAGRLNKTLGTSAQAAEFISTQVDDMAWRNITNKYTNLPLEQVEAMDALVTSNFNA